MFSWRVEKEVTGPKANTGGREMIENLRKTEELWSGHQ